MACTFIENAKACCEAADGFEVFSSVVLSVQSSFMSSVGQTLIVSPNDRRYPSTQAFLIKCDLGDDVTMGIWTLAEISIGIVSACLPTMRPLFSKGIARLRVPPVEQDLRAPETREDSNSTLDVTLQRTPSLPALSQKFAHLGVLGNLPPA